MGILEDIKKAEIAANNLIKSAVSTANKIISGFGVGGIDITKPMSAEDIANMNAAANEANSITGGGIETTGASNIMDDYNKNAAVYRISLTKVTNSAHENTLSGEQTKLLDEITDFHYLAFVRDPITKQSTYIDAQAMVPTATLVSIETAIANNNFQEYELQIKLMKEVEESDTSTKSTEQKLIYSGFVLIIASDSQKDPLTTARLTTGADASIPARLILVNPIAYDMSKQTGFNKIFSPVVSPDKPEIHNPVLIALETIINNAFNPQIKDSKLTSFMDYVINSYAANEFDIKQVVLADKSKVNLSNYSQITIPPTIPEINVPEYIINTYKPFSTPSFWFFDTFNFANYDRKSEPINGRIPIWCFLICFFNAAKVFTQVDVSIYDDVNKFTHLLSTGTFNDVQGILNKPNAVVNFINTGNMTCITKTLGSNPFVLQSDNTSTKSQDRVTSFVIKYKGDIGAAQTRIVDSWNMFTHHIHQVEYYETTNTTPEWLQFGQIYNLEKDKETGINKNNYLHTPICIINIFKRRQAKDNTMECINKYAMLRLVDQENYVPSAIPDSSALTKQSPPSPPPGSTVI